MTTPSARPGRIGTVLASASALLLTVIACTTNPPAKTTSEVSVVRVDTSAGSAPRWTTKVLFSTAGVDSLALWYAFDAVFANDTSLLVGSTGTIWRIGGDGARVQRVAVEGNAPGQFERIMRLAAAADGSILVGDIYNDSRMTQIMPDGRLLRVIPRGDGGLGPREVEPITALPDGRVITSWWQWRPNRGDIVGIPVGHVERDSVPLLVQDGAGHGLRTLGVWPGLERARIQVEDEVWRLPVPNARSVVYDSRGSTTVIGVSDSIDLTIMDGTTPTHRLVAAARRRAATQTERNAWERTVQRDHPDESPQVLAAEQHVRLNDFLPDVGGVVVDGGRNVWVGNYPAAADSTRTWVVYSPDGKARGSVELPVYHEALVPSRTELLDVYGDRLAVLRGDAPGARYVEIRQLVKR